jgi:hypothetical protein
VKRGGLVDSAFGFSAFSLSDWRSDDRQALAALETAGFDDFAAALGGHTGTVTNLAGALLAVRADCRLHDF